MRYAVAVVSPCGVWRYLDDRGKRPLEGPKRDATVHASLDAARDRAEAYRGHCAGQMVHIEVVDIDDDEWSDSYAD